MMIPREMLYSFLCYPLSQTVVGGGVCPLTSILRPTTSSLYPAQLNVYVNAFLWHSLFVFPLRFIAYSRVFPSSSTCVGCVTYVSHFNKFAFLWHIFYVYEWMIIVNPFWLIFFVVSISSFLDSELFRYQSGSW